MRGLRSQVDWSRLGANLKALRQIQGLTIRAVAARADVDKNTVLRLEKGSPIIFRSLELICRSVGSNLERELLRTRQEEGRTVSREEDWLWTRSTSKKTDAAWDELNLSDPSVRRRRASAGADSVFNALITTHARSSLVPCVCEVHADTNPSPVQGELVLFCLEGSVRLRIGGEEFNLGPGDTATLGDGQVFSFSPIDGRRARLFTVRLQP
jgi:transcriptional regulator with XRE-family HTH domain